MQPKQDTYPVFEANQVLTNRHLNQVFDYLDEQERLTRANLIGIGIVCGLEIQLAADGKSISLWKGCGVTSKGYLLVEPAEKVSLVEYKNYILPDEIDEYLPFKYDAPDPNDSTKTIRVQYDLWEMFEAGEPNSTKLGDAPANFLNDKAVLLFLELKKDGLRNCSPNNCDDKGAEVTATVRRLLVRIADLTKIIAAANQQGTSLTPADLESVLLARLKLPDLRLPRYNVPNTEPATSEDVLGGFLDVFRDNVLSQATGAALTEAYKAFQPLLEDEYPTDPFAADFATKFGFLDTAPNSITQVRFLQYYYDLFDDLLKAYDEFRWKGVELMCACCPPEGLFPRHLMLGVLRPDLVAQAAIYRHPFLASSAISGCEEHTKEVVLLFGRMVEMVRSFTDQPALFPSKEKGLGERIRITPSKLADVPLSEKAIPYYYKQDGAPPLFQRWNAMRNRRGRANQNLSYRSYQYAPAPPAFVTNPLRYDLEPYNFLRIEGHLGQNYQDALDSLLQMKESFRLPIEIIALRTGAFEENIAVNLNDEDCRFQDLETLYEVTREEWFCFLAKEVTYLYNIPFNPEKGIGEVKTKSQFQLINKYAPDFLVSSNTTGEWFEAYVKSQGGNVLEFPPDFLSGIIKNFPPSDFFAAYTFFYIFNSYTILQAELKSLDYTKLKFQFDGLGKVAATEEERRELGLANTPNTALAILKWEELDDRLEDILNTCLPEVFKAILDEYARRITELKQKQFLSFFLDKNPGIQHKAGVPIGGTFILVYHDDIEQQVQVIEEQPLFAGFLATNANAVNTTVDKTTTLQKNVVKVATEKKVTGVINRILSLNNLSANDKQIIANVLGQNPDLQLAVLKGDPFDEAVEKIMAETVSGLTDGTVIADFYLPYLCCSDCSPVQFTLPPIPPTFSFQIGCTSANNQAEVTFNPAGGVAPYSIKVDGDDYTPLSGKMLLTAGDHDVTIRDSAGIQSLPQKVTVQGVLSFSAETAGTYECDPNNQFTVQFTMQGGRPPYTSPQGVFTGNQFKSSAVPSGDAIEIEVTDSAGCKASKRFTHVCQAPCDLPCEGEAIRRNYRFWIPIGSTKNKKPVLNYNFDIGTFSFEGPGKEIFNLEADVQAIVGEMNEALFNSKFKETVQQRWMEPLNKLIDEQTKTEHWLHFEYIQDDKAEFGMLQIESFECLPFEFSFFVAYNHPELREAYRITYSDQGMVIAVQEPAGAGVPISIPPMNRERLNKCKGETVWQPDCKGEPFKLNIVEKTVKELRINLAANTSGGTKPTLYLWEVPEAIPSISIGNKVELQQINDLPKTIHVRVTAFDANGCSVTVEDTITFPQ